MTLMLFGFLLLAVAELLLYTPPLWHLRKLLAPAVLLPLLVYGEAQITVGLNAISYVILGVVLYRCFNLLRLIAGVVPEEYLRYSGIRSSLSLLGLQAIAFGAWYLDNRFPAHGSSHWIVLAVLQLACSVVLLRTVLREQRHTAPLHVDSPRSDNHLPSITVAIPARNETDSLEACLRSLVASDYPKLEILVLDDCSQDRTAETIKQFAHDGVRFVRGTVPPEHWLAKNWAYEQLYKQANGDVLVFCGVDIRFSRSSLRQLITILLEKDKKMLSLMPLNEIMPAKALTPLMIQPMRYAWEICLPRRMFNRPPVLSSVWLIERALVKRSGTFAAVKKSTSPESHFAKAAVAKDSYSFVRSDEELGITSRKSFEDQLDTAIRTRYPQLHRRIEMVLIVSAIELFGFIASLPLALISLCLGQWLLGIISGLAAIVIGFVYYRVVWLTYHTTRPAAFLALPLAVGYDVVLRHVSMWRYEFSSVEWKGRNVCLPVMQVTPRLPKID